MSLEPGMIALFRSSTCSRNSTRSDHAYGVGKAPPDCACERGTGGEEIPPNLELSRAWDGSGPRGGSIFTRWAEGPRSGAGGVILFGPQHFRAASGCSGQPSDGFQDSEQNGIFLGQNVPFRPILSHPYLLIWSVRNMSREPEGGMQEGRSCTGGKPMTRRHAVAFAVCGGGFDRAGVARNWPGRAQGGVQGHSDAARREVARARRRPAASGSDHAGNVQHAASSQGKRRPTP